MNNINTIRNLVFGILLTFIYSSHLQAQSVVASGYTFSASSKTYSYLTGGTRVTAVEVDDAFTTIPIGFTFRFCGANFTDVTVCSNGWLRFGTGAGSAVANWNYNATPNSGIEPAVYALYEDVSGVGGTSSYLVTGTAPNRIFKWECRDWLWDYAASSASVSFQVWLYENTGLVECLYKQEAGSVSLGTSGGATIGIGNSSTDWQVLNGVGANPTSSSSTYTANLSAVPATGQSYQWDPGAPCAQPTGLLVTLVNSTYAEFTWNATPASIGYEYVVDQNSGAPATSTGIVSTNTLTGNRGNLTPNSLYYIHLRNKCGTNNYSPWVTISFNTLPPCVIPNPPGIQVPKVDSNSATVTWQTVGTSIEYEYVIKTDDTPPSAGAATQSSTSNTVNLTSLLSGTTYYIFLRVKCQGNDSSSWIKDSIYVPIPCRAPNVKFTDVNTERAVLSWDPPITSYEYEILNSASAVTNPSAGILLTNNSYLFSYLDYGSTYYVYARSYCNDKGIKTTSDWSSSTYSTWQLGVDDILTRNRAIKVAPNPVNDKITILVGNVTKSSMVSILDITGKVLMTQPANSTEVSIDVSNLSRGLYIVSYTDQFGKTQKKFNKI